MRYSLCLIDLFLQLTLQSHYQETTRQTTIHFLSTCATQSCNFINYSKWQSDSATFERRLLYKLGMMSQNNKSKRFAQWLHLQGHQYSKPRMGQLVGVGMMGMLWAWQYLLVANSSWGRVVWGSPLWMYIISLLFFPLLPFLFFLYISNSYSMIAQT